LVVERNFAEFSGEFARDYFRKRHDPVLGSGVMVPSAMHTQDLKTKVSPWLKATVGLMEIKVVEFAMRSSARSPTWRVSCRCFRPATYQEEYPR
jgi:hypothetical protein